MQLLGYSLLQSAPVIDKNNKDEIEKVRIVLCDLRNTLDE